MSMLHAQAEQGQRQQATLQAWHAGAVQVGGGVAVGLIYLGQGRLPRGDKPQGPVPLGEYADGVSQPPPDLLGLLAGTS